MMSPSLHETLVVCLGGGLRRNGVPAHIAARVRRSVKIATSYENSALLFSSSFTLNKDVILDYNGIPMSEASTMSGYARNIEYQGHLYCEQQSHDTIGSAYFVFSDFVSFITPKQIFVVTGDFHIQRVTVIFSHLAFLFRYSGTMIFVGTDSAIAGPRAKKEKVATKNYLTQWSKLSELHEFRKVLFERHSNYNVNFNSKPLPKSLLYSY